MPSFYEFFAGGGMARAGLGSNWQCLFANDFDRKKGRVYEDNWGKDAISVGDVGKLTIADLPTKSPDAVWASFPCQDLSLAGGGAGLKGDRSGTFWPFWKLMKALIKNDRAPTLVVLENVCGTLTSHKGKDFSAICDALTDSNYRCGAVIIDAALFVPQSRPRLFVIGVRDAIEVPKELSGCMPHALWHPRTLKNAYSQLPHAVQANWIWWNFKEPSQRNIRFCDIIEENPISVKWHTLEETRHLLEMMSSINLLKVEEAKKAGRRIVGTIYKRTRINENGRKVQRAEVRFDDVAGCLRTPAGGSSRQSIIVVDGNNVRTRLISSRETARLMGLPDEYLLPKNYNEAYHLTGDGVVVPVVRHLARYVLEPILSARSIKSREAA